MKINQKSYKCIIQKQNVKRSETKNFYASLFNTKSSDWPLFITHCRIDSWQILRLIVIAFWENLSAENSKLSADSGIHGIPLLECLPQQSGAFWGGGNSQVAISISIEARTLSRCPSALSWERSLKKASGSQKWEFENLRGGFVQHCLKNERNGDK